MATSKKQKPINLNPNNAGKLRATAGVKAGQKIPVKKLQQLAASPNKTTAARAQFALNARAWANGKKKKSS